MDLTRALLILGVAAACGKSGDTAPGTVTDTAPGTDTATDTATDTDTAPPAAGWPFVWGVADGAISAIAVAGRPDGSVVVLASAQGALEVGGETLTTDQADALVFVLDADGGLLWSATWGGSTSYENTTGLAIAGDGVVVSGSYWSDIDLAPGAQTDVYLPDGPRDGYLLKLDADGAREWAAVFTGPAQIDPGSVAGDSAGRVYTVGVLAPGSADLDPGAGTATVSVDIDTGFVVALEADGSYRWAGLFDADPVYGRVSPFHAEVDAAGDLYVIGSCSGLIDLDPTDGVWPADCGDAGGAFVVKLDPDGAVQWHDVWQATGDMAPYATDLTTDGQLLLAGGVAGAVDLDPGAGEDLRPGVGDTDAFFVRVGADGAYVGGQTVRSESLELIFAAGLSADGHQLYAGNFDGTTDFDPGDGTGALTAADPWSIFAAAYGPDDALLWAEEPDEAVVNAVDGGEGSVLWATGSFAHTADLALGSAGDVHAPVGDRDLGVWRLDAAE
jgi:hypothetical protein